MLAMSNRRFVSRRTGFAGGAAVAPTWLTDTTHSSAPRDPLAPPGRDCADVKTDSSITR